MLRSFLRSRSSKPPKMPKGSSMYSAKHCHLTGHLVQISLALLRWRFATEVLPGLNHQLRFDSSSLHAALFNQGTDRQTKTSRSVSKFALNFSSGSISVSYTLCQTGHQRHRNLVYQLQR